MAINRIRLRKNHFPIANSCRKEAAPKSRVQRFVYICFFLVPLSLGLASIAMTLYTDGSVVNLLE